MLARVGREIGPHLREGQLVLSVLAGPTTSVLVVDPRPRPGRAGDAQHARPHRQRHDRLVRDAGDDRRAARPGEGAARRARRGARGRGREVGRDGHRRLGHRPRLRVPRDGGADRRRRPPRLPAPRRPRPRHRDPRGQHAVRQAVRRPPRGPAQHGHVARAARAPPRSTSWSRAACAPSCPRRSSPRTAAPSSWATRWRPSWPIPPASPAPGRADLSRWRSAAPARPPPTNPSR